MGIRSEAGVIVMVLVALLTTFAPLQAQQGEEPNIYQTFRQSDFSGYDSVSGGSSDRMGEAAGKLLGLAKPFAILGMIAGLVLLGVGVFSQSHKPATSGGIMLGGSTLLFASTWAFAAGSVVFLVARHLYLERKRAREEELERIKSREEKKSRRAEDPLGAVSVRSAVRATKDDPLGMKKKKKKKSRDDDEDEADEEFVFKEPDVHIKLTRPL